MFLVLSDRTVDLHARWVRTDEGTVDLTPREAELLACLLDHAGQTVSRDTLLAQVWGMTRPVVTRCVDTAVRRLRVKLEPEPSSPRHLLSVPGEGYRLQVERPAASGADGRAPERARLLAALLAHPRVHVVGPPGSDPRGLVRSAAAERGWQPGRDLRILDDLPDAPPDGMEIVLAPAPPGAAVVPLPPLPASAARATLLRACQRLGLLGDPDLHDILEMCDPLPVVLDRVADWLQVSPTSAVLARLADPVAAFPDLAAELEPAWLALAEADRSALAALCAIEGSLEAAELEPALGVSLHAADRLLRAGWLSERDGRLAPSRLQRAWVRAHRPTPAARTRWARWLPHAWLTAIQQARARGRSLHRLDPAVLDAAFDACAQDDPTRAALLCRALDALHFDTGHPPDVLARFEQVLRLELPPDDRALILRMRGTALRRQGRLRAAFRDLDEAVRIARDPQELGLCTAWRGTLHQVAQRREEAAQDLRAALPLILTPRQRIACQTALAVIEAGLGEHVVALDRARAAAHAARELGHEHLVLLADRCLGTVLTEAGHTIEARPRLRRAADTAARLGAARQRLLCLRDLARAALDDGDSESATRWLEQAREHADGIASAWIDADLAELRALTAWLDTDRDLARTWLERALVLRTDEDPESAGTALAWLALWHARAERRDLAERLWHQARQARWSGPAAQAFRNAADAALRHADIPDGSGGWEQRLLRRILAKDGPS